MQHKIFIWLIYSYIGTLLQVLYHNDEYNRIFTDIEVDNMFLPHLSE